MKFTMRNRLLADFNHTSLTDIVLQLLLFLLLSSSFMVQTGIKVQVPNAETEEAPGLGTLVTGVIYRYPGMLVKTATTLDVLSGGRAYLGLGAAWFEREALGVGMPFPPLRERFEQLEEALRIAHAMWAGDMTPIKGRHYRLEEPLSRPQPLAQPHPPILIGGGGERKTLRLVAQYAAACNLFAYDGTKPIRRKLDVLKRHCESVGRPYEAIERTALSRLEDITRPGPCRSTRSA